MKARSLDKIRKALAASHHVNDGWKLQRANIAALTDVELDEAEGFERLGKRRLEILKMILYERGKRHGWKRKHYPGPEIEAHL